MNRGDRTAMGGAVHDTDMMPTIHGDPESAHTAVADPRPGLVHPVAGGVLALAAAMGIGRFAYTPILPAMEAAAHLDTAQAGLLAAANYAGYLVGALLIAVVVP